MSLLSRIFAPAGAGIVCPCCEKSLEGHDEGACARRMSRRFFFGAVAGAIAAAAAHPTGEKYLQIDELKQRYLDKAALSIANKIDRQFERNFQFSGVSKIGAPIYLSRPIAIDHWHSVEFHFWTNDECLAVPSLP